jgi:5'-nucleotidase
VVNDDGIRSPGIAALARVAAQLGETYVVSPSEQCSGMSQRLTLFDEMALREERFPVPVAGAWSLGGAPADCVKVALAQVLDFMPDYVFSGVNDGWNVGYDIAYSGTIGACYEAVMNGIPAIAFSARMKGELEIAERYMPELARELIDLGQKPGEIWNVNFPGGTLHDVRGILRERRIAPMQLYNGVFSSRIHPEGYKMLSQQGVPIGRGVAPEGSDIAAVLDGYISVGKIMSPVM